MKKIKFQKKLSLNKETIAKLNEDQMNQIKGGTMRISFTDSRLTSCTIWACDTELRRDKNHGEKSRPTQTMSYLPFM